MALVHEKMPVQESTNSSSIGVNGLVPKDFEFFRKNPYRGVGPVLGTLSFFEKIPMGVCL